MRTIKFRGKRGDNDEWVFGSFIPDALERGNSDLVSWGFIRRYNRDIGKMETMEVDRETVGQFTGLVDKNGKEAYEGDTIKSHYANAVKSEHTETIVFYSGSFRAECKIGETGRSLSLLADGIPHLSQDKSVYMEYFEIIGNIHERSEV